MPAEKPILKFRALSERNSDQSECFEVEFFPTHAHAQVWNDNLTFMQHYSLEVIVYYASVKYLR